MALRENDARRLAARLAGRLPLPGQVLAALEREGLLVASEPHATWGEASRSGDVGAIFLDYMDRRGNSWSVEHLVIFMLDARNHVLAVELVAMGGLTGVSVYPREIFRAALKHDRCAAILLVHNHPSGALQGSPADRKLTRKVKELGDTMGLPMLDHVVVNEWGDCGSILHE